MESKSINNNESNIINSLQTSPIIKKSFTSVFGKVRVICSDFYNNCFKPKVLAPKVLSEEDQKKARQFKFLLTEIKTTETSYQAGLQTLEDTLSMLATSTKDEEITKWSEIAKNMNTSSKLFLKKIGNAEKGEDLLNAFNEDDIKKIYENFENYLTCNFGYPVQFLNKLKTHKLAISKFFNKRAAAFFGCNPQVVKVNEALGELQIIPTQRMARYGLLLREATKLIENDKAQQTTEMLELVSEKTSGVNEAKRKVEHKKMVGNESLKIMLKYLKEGRNNAENKKKNCFVRFFNRIFKK